MVLYCSKHGISSQISKGCIDLQKLSIILMFFHHQRQAPYESFSGSTKNNVYYPTDRPIDPTGRINNSGGLDAFRLDGTVLVQ